MKRYRVVYLEDAVDGTQLFHDVSDRHGNLLLPAGTVLNAVLVRSLQRRDIELVLAVDDTVTAEQLALEHEQLTERLNYLFRNCAGEPATVLLREAVEQYRLETQP